MDQSHFPTIVIGSGSAGLTVAIGLAQLGRDVALIEAKDVGGDCTNVGCVPSKTLIHEARRGHAESAAEVLATVQRKRDDLRARETDEVQQIPHLSFIRGRARFTAPKSLDVLLSAGGVRTLTGDNIVIATGARPTLLPIDGLPPYRLLTNENLFELTRPPGHLAIVGSGPIALEMAFAFRDLGARVSIVTLDDRVLISSPTEASDTLRRSLDQRGVDVYDRSSPRRYDEPTETLWIDGPSGALALEGVGRVLVAIGRTRNIDDLGLEHTGVAFERAAGIAVDSFGQTSVRGIYAIGDVTPTSRWTHSANAQGRRVVQRIAFPWLPALSQEPLYPNATFSDPEVANVGLMPEQIARRFHPRLVKTLRFELADTDKGYTEGLRHGFVQVYALRLTGRILGATIVGPRASEMISLFTLAITRKITLYSLYRLVYPYPTLSGAIGKIADQYVRETLPAFHTELLDVARYRALSVWQRLRGGAFEIPAPEGQPMPETSAAA